MDRETLANRNEALLTNLPLKLQFFMERLQILIAQQKFGSSKDQVMEKHGNWLLLSLLLKRQQQLMTITTVMKCPSLGGSIFPRDYLMNLPPMTRIVKR
jgi:hypothetical protein